MTAENLEEMLYSTGVKVLTDLHSGRVGASAAKAAAAALGSLHELFLRLGTLAKPEDRPADLHISIMTEAEEAEAQRRASAGDDEIEGGECEILEPGWSPPVMNEADEARVRAAVEGVAESAAEASRNGESSSELPPHRHEAEQPSPFIGSPPAPICPPFLPGPLPERERFRNWLDYVAKRNGNSALRQVLRYGLGRSVGNQTPRSELIDEIIGATGGDPSRLAAFVIGE
ncbi:MAG TPA: hypothetical protein VK196_05235 [Magnetospirillum sp.]|nr:hypothetical protein [Magnetospirillum sp.]